jgi:hypothetical protein
MHQYKTFAQTLLFLSIFNLAFAAPVAVQEKSDTGDGVVVLAEGVATASVRRGGTEPGEIAPPQYSSSSPNGSPPHNPLPQEGSTSLQGLSPSGGSAPSPYLPATDGPVPAHDSTMEGSTPSQHVSATDGPVSVHGSTAEVSTATPYTQVTHDMLSKDPESAKMKKIKTAGGVLGLTAVIAGIVLLETLHTNDNH